MFPEALTEGIRRKGRHMKWRTKMNLVRSVTTSRLQSISLGSTVAGLKSKFKSYSELCDLGS